MVIVIGRVRCDEENRDELIAALKVMQTQSRLEDGCIRYGFFSAVEDPGSFTAVEEWADRDALDVHFTQEHLQDFSKTLLSLASEAPEVAIHQIEGTSAYAGRD